MAKNNCRFELKTIKLSDLKKITKKLKKKKSAGKDGLSQENLINGASSLIAPLTTIINQSITDGQFPSDWKEALTLKKNYFKKNYF